MNKSRDLDAAQIDGARALAASPDVPADTDWASFDSGKANADQHRAAGRYSEAQAEQARAALEPTMHSGAGFQPEIEKPTWPQQQHSTTLSLAGSKQC
jgi:hypothetical protein